MTQCSKNKQQSLLTFENVFKFNITVVVYGPVLRPFRQMHVSPYLNLYLPQKLL